MPNGSAEEGVECPVDLAANDQIIRFSDEALRYSSHLNIYTEGRVVLHLKFIPLRGAFVLNDMQAGAWGEESLIPFQRAGSSEAITVRLSLLDGILTVQIQGGAVVSFADRFDLDGKLIARVPPVISFEAAKPSIVLPAMVRADPDPDPDPKPLTMALQPLQSSGVAYAIDVAVVSESAFFVEGWVDDRRSAASGILCIDRLSGQRGFLPLIRVRRPDVEAHLQAGRPGEFGFWTAGLGGVDRLETSDLSLVFEDGSWVPLVPGAPVRRNEDELFDLLLANFGRRNVIGNATARGFADLDAGFGEVLGGVYKQIAAARRTTITARFGDTGVPPKISLICVIFGLPDFLYLLVAQFARFARLDGLEFVFVNNSPELEEVLLRDAEIASLVFGAEIQVVGLNQNCGFSHANNVGAKAARGQKFAIINPDVFPRDGAAIQHLLDLAAGDMGNDIYGGKLYYADGSVMHEGMYFERDQKLSVLCDMPIWTVEHFRKGFADTASRAVRPVPAITGALMVLERRLFERMGGFKVDFIFGHYEDADLCLRIRKAGGRVLSDPGLAYWHYESIGSTKRPEHSGSNMYNRWYFSREWGRSLQDANHV